MEICSLIRNFGSHMRFFKKYWDAWWEFNSPGEYISFLAGRVLWTLIFIFLVYLLINLVGSPEPVTFSTVIKTSGQFFVDAYNLIRFLTSSI